MRAQNPANILGEECIGRFTEELFFSEKSREELNRAIDNILKETNTNLFARQAGTNQTLLHFAIDFYKPEIFGALLNHSLTQITPPSQGLLIELNAYVEAKKSQVTNREESSTLQKITTQIKTTQQIQAFDLGRMVAQRGAEGLRRAPSAPAASTAAVGPNLEYLSPGERAKRLSQEEIDKEMAKRLEAQFREEGGGGALDARRVEEIRLAREATERFLIEEKRREEERQRQEEADARAAKELQEQLEAEGGKTPDEIRAEIRRRADDATLRFLAKEQREQAERKRQEEADAKAARELQEQLEAEGGRTPEDIRAERIRQDEEAARKIFIMEQREQEERKRQEEEDLRKMTERLKIEERERERQIRERQKQDEEEATLRLLAEEGLLSLPAAAMGGESFSADSSAAAAYGESTPFSISSSGSSTPDSPEENRGAIRRAETFGARRESFRGAAQLQRDEEFTPSPFSPAFTSSPSQNMSRPASAIIESRRPVSNPISFTAHSGAAAMNEESAPTHSPAAAIAFPAAASSFTFKSYGEVVFRKSIGGGGLLKKGNEFQGLVIEFTKENLAQEFSFHLCRKMGHENSAMARHFECKDKRFYIRPATEDQGIGSYLSPTPLSPNGISIRFPNEKCREIFYAELGLMEGLYGITSINPVGIQTVAFFPGLHEEKNQIRHQASSRPISQSVEGVSR